MVRSSSSSLIETGRGRTGGPGRGLVPGERRTRRVSLTLVLAVVTLVVLAASAPAALADAYEKGGIYLFSQAFLTDIPRRLTGPGRFRFVLQPLMAITLGIRSGLADARAGRGPYIYELLFHRGARASLLKSGFEAIANVVLFSILLDAIAQWLILGVSYPGAAIVVGPVLISVPYALARALSNRVARRF
ncbi:MAG TPA: hypothetical protein VD833_25225 [Vicinamibacterales bacterium]|nr:hypothetical protein [Vicinamibacterales bacterium]